MYVEPARLDKYRLVVPSRFDIGLVNFKEGGPAGVKGMSIRGIFISFAYFTTGYCAARIRCIFSLPPTAVASWFPQGFRHEHLAYVERYTPFRQSAFEKDSRMYGISPPTSEGGVQKSSAIPVTLMRESLHLFPKFGAAAPTSWKSSSVLDRASIFFRKTLLRPFPIFSSLLGML